MLRPLCQARQTFWQPVNSMKCAKATTSHGHVPAHPTSWQADQTHHFVSSKSSASMARYCWTQILSATQNFRRSSTIKLTTILRRCESLMPLAMRTATSTTSNQASPESTKLTLRWRTSTLNDSAWMTAHSNLVSIAVVIKRLLAKTMLFYLGPPMSLPRRKRRPIMRRRTSGRISQLKLRKADTTTKSTLRIVTVSTTIEHA
jgi:hypothetical protein